MAARDAAYQEADAREDSSSEVQAVYDGLVKEFAI